MKGQRIVLTRPREQAAELASKLEALGAEVIEFPTIEIRPPADPRPLEDAVRRLGEYDWLIFTSVNGVRSFAERRPEPGAFRGRVCAIGPATKQAAERMGFTVALMPREYVAEGLVEAFAAEDLKGKRILLPRAAVARDVAPEELRRRGAQVEVVEAYRTVLPEGAPALAREVFGRRKPHWITFTSSSTVTNFVAAAGTAALEGVRVASIGPVTSATARAAGIHVDAEATEYTAAGLVAAILRAQSGSRGTRADRGVRPTAYNVGAMTPDELLQIIRAFQESRTLLTAVELDIFSQVGSGAAAAEVAVRIKADARATEMLLNALVSLGVLQKKGDVFSNAPVAGEQLTAPEKRLALMHFVNLWTRWSTLTDCVRKGTQAARDPIEARPLEWTEAFIAAMHQNAQGRAPLVVEAVGAEKVRRMLDVGGGSGAYSIAFAHVNPELVAEILDLPAVIPIASRHVAAAGLAGRVRVRSGDLKRDDFGGGYDLVFVSSICHMLSPDENRRLLGRCNGALRPGGRIVIQDFVLNADKTSPRPAALFSLNMLVGTERGASYSEPEYRAWLTEAGFREPVRLDLPGPSLMIATK